MNWDEIVVSSKIQGHISAGIYRSAGGALKELVSNAFDADATRVTITTNHPSFDIITCRDNGNGITPDQFRNIMRGGIGDSLKRVDSEFTANGRPLIGRLGIGMLGIAQICHVFEVVSHCRSTKTAFKATVKLADYLHEKMDNIGPDTNLEIDSEAEDKSIDVGKFLLTEIDYDPTKSGTYIMATDMRTAFVNKFRENHGPALPMQMDKFLDTIDKFSSLRELGDYWQMVWEMAVSCPISYLEKGPFNDKISFLPSIDTLAGDTTQSAESNEETFAAFTQGLENFKFELIVDGLKLSKPTQFPSPSKNRGRDIRGTVFLINKELKVAGRPLKMFGYIYLQDGVAIVPMELRGLLIRIRNSAIGTYDPTFLNYPKIEGPRYNWLSGEIYVEQGLEHALNIDRDSFNQMHPHYVRLQKIVHELLPQVFSEAAANVNKRSQTKKQNERDEKNRGLKVLVQDELNGEFSVVEAKAPIVEPKTTATKPIVPLEKGKIPVTSTYTPVKKPSVEVTPITINREQEEIIIDISSDLWPKSKPNREIAQRIAVAFELAMEEQEDDRKKKRFYELLTKVLEL